jgi:hypothetical protein
MESWMGLHDSHWVMRYWGFGVMQCTRTCQIKPSRVKAKRLFQATIMIYDRLTDLAWAWEVDLRQQTVKPNPIPISPESPDAEANRCSE